MDEPNASSVASYTLEENGCGAISYHRSLSPTTIGLVAGQIELNPRAITSLRSLDPRSLPSLSKYENRAFAVYELLPSTSKKS